MIRGDPAVMTAEIIEAFVFAWGLGLLARFLFGTAAVPNQSVPVLPATPAYGPPLHPIGR
jgi:hypothetical protein